MEPSVAMLLHIYPASLVSRLHSVQLLSRVDHMLYSLVIVVDFVDVCRLC